jgi:hypothetical protein
MDFFRKRKSILITLGFLIVADVVVYWLTTKTDYPYPRLNFVAIFYLIVGLIVSNLIVLFFRKSFSTWYKFMIVLFLVCSYIMFNSSPDKMAYVGLSNLQGEIFIFPVLLIFVTILIIIIRGLLSLSKKPSPAKK